jgi:transketolase
MNRHNFEIPKGEKLSESTNLTLEAETLATKSRLIALKMVSKSKTSHIGSALSVIDIVSCLYVSNLHLNSKNKDSLRIVFSKGHATTAVYAVLNALGLISDEIIDNYCNDGSQTYGHINHLVHDSIELSTGSLGHGLPFGVGMALASARLHKTEKIVVVMSDGECDEGTTWESALIAAHHKLSNLIVIIDRNNIQSFGHTEEVLQLNPLADKWNSFGWNTKTINGNVCDEILSNLNQFTSPTCLIAETIKGKGVSFMENELAWHYKSPSDAELVKASKEINGPNA